LGTIRVLNSQEVLGKSRIRREEESSMGMDWEGKGRLNNFLLAQSLGWFSQVRKTQTYRIKKQQQ